MADILTSATSYSRLKWNIPTYERLNASRRPLRRRAQRLFPVRGGRIRALPRGTTAVAKPTRCGRRRRQGVQLERPTVYALEEKLQVLPMPVLVMIGDEDGPCVGPAIFMKRVISNAGLSVIAQSGHTINLEEPDLFNRTVSDFLTAVEGGRWVKGEG